MGRIPSHHISSLDAWIAQLACFRRDRHNLLHTALRMNLTHGFELSYSCSKLLCGSHGLFHEKTMASSAWHSEPLTALPPPPRPHSSVTSVCLQLWWCLHSSKWPLSSGSPLRSSLCVERETLKGQVRKPASSAGLTNNGLCDELNHLTTAVQFPGTHLWSTVILCLLFIITVAHYGCSAGILSSL